MIGSRHAAGGRKEDFMCKALTFVLGNNLIDDRYAMLRNNKKLFGVRHSTLGDEEKLLDASHPRVDLKNN